MLLLKQLFSSATPYGRVVRTFIQAFIGICVAIVSVLAFPGFSDWFGKLDWFAQVGGVAGVIAIITTIQNALEQLWNNIKGW